MRLLIPTTDTNGASAQMSGHFGRAPYYAVADNETGQWSPWPTLLYPTAMASACRLPTFSAPTASMPWCARGSGAALSIGWLRRECPSTFTTVPTLHRRSPPSEAALCTWRAQMTAAQAPVPAAAIVTITTTE